MTTESQKLMPTEETQKPKPARRNGIVLTFQVSEAIKRKLTAAAGREARSLSSWMRLVLCREAEAMEELVDFVEQLSGDSAPQMQSDPPKEVLDFFAMVNRSVDAAEGANAIPRGANVFKKFQLQVAELIKSGRFAWQDGDLTPRGEVTLEGTKKAHDFVATVLAMDDGISSDLWRELKSVLVSKGKYHPWRPLK
jgi:hypothetical protein